MPEPKPEEILKILASRYKVVADLVAENDKLKDALADYQTKSGPPVAKKVVAEVVEPESTPLPTEPEAPEVNDDASAADWGDEPAPAEPTKPRRSRK